MIEIKDIPFPYQKSTRNKLKKQQTGHPSKYPQGYFKDKPCKRCSIQFSPKAPSEHYCSDWCKDEGLSDSYLKREYKVSLDEYRQMYINQDGKCAICNSVGFKLNSDRVANSVTLNLDHCHVTKKPRGLLCHNCNRALGMFNDDMDVLSKAILYIKWEGPTTISKESTLQANGSGSGEPLTGNAEGEDIV